MTLDGKILRGLFEHERLKPAMIRMSNGNINSLVQLKQVLTLGIVIDVTLWCCYATAPGTLGYTRHLLGLVSWVCK